MFRMPRAEICRLDGLGVGLSSGGPSSRARSSMKSELLRSALASTARYARCNHYRDSARMGLKNGSAKVELVLSEPPGRGNFVFGSRRPACTRSAHRCIPGTRSHVAQRLVHAALFVCPCLWLAVVVILLSARAGKQASDSERSWHESNRGRACEYPVTTVLPSPTATARNEC